MRAGGGEWEREGERAVIAAARQRWHKSERGRGPRPLEWANTHLAADLNGAGR
jgi:hypothetical protein